MALLRNLVRSLIQHKKIRTTEAKAKEAKRMAEKLLTTAKTDSLYARRKARRVLCIADRMTRSGGGKTATGEKRISRNDEMIKHLFTEIVPKLSGRQGGYTRITKLGHRQGDASPMVLLELILEE